MAKTHRDLTDVTAKGGDMNIFEFAMEKEKYSEDYYRQLADKSNNKGPETVFNMLAC